MVKTRSKKVLLTLLLVSSVIALENLIAGYTLRNLLIEVKASEAHMIEFNNSYRDFPTKSIVEQTVDLGLGSPSKFNQEMWNYKKINGGMVNTTSVQEAMNAWLTDMNSIAFTTNTNLLQSEFELEQIFVLPWRQNMELAKIKYLEHNTSWVNYTRDFMTLTDISELDNFLKNDYMISPTFNISKRAFLQSTPLLDLYGNKQLVLEIFAE